MLENYLNGTPGVKSDYQAAIRELLMTYDEKGYFPMGVAIDGSKSRDPGNTDRTDILRAGLPMGKLTASGKYAPSIIGVTAGALANGGTSLVIGGPNAAAELVRRIGATGSFKLTGPATAGGVARTVTITYSAVGSGTGTDEVQTITFTGTATAGTWSINATDKDGVIQTTADLAYNADSTAVTNAINAVLGTSAVSASGTMGTGFAVTFSGTGYAKANQSAMTANIGNLTGVTAYAVAETTRGVFPSETITITAPSVNEVQTIVMPGTLSSGTWRIGAVNKDGVMKWTTALAYNADAAAITAALNVILGTSAVAVTGDYTGFAVTFSGTNYAGVGQPMLSLDVNDLVTDTNPTITRTTAAVDGRFVSGSFIQPADGSENIVTLFANKYGVKVTDDRLLNIDVQYPDLLVNAMVRTSVIVNYPTDTGLKAWLKAQLRSRGGNWVFDDDFIG